jgi:ABC-type uncharacterized transport system auxiliary subunit
MKRYQFGIIAIILCLDTILCSCVGPKTKRLTTEFYHLYYDPPSKIVDTPFPFAVSVEPFQAVPPYDSTRIVYTTSPYSINFYPYHEWINSPAEMATSLLARDIKDANIFSAVLNSDDRLARYRITGVVESFYEKDLKKEWKAELSIMITLIKIDENNMTNKICFQKNYSTTQTCRKRNPEGLADAMSIAMSSISEMILADIQHTLSK